jgi:stage II sporulation protein R
MIDFRIMKMNIRRDKLLLSVVAIILSLYMAFSYTYFIASAGSVREEVVRLHILANSDSFLDQGVKLKVRDALLQRNKELLLQGTDKESAHVYFLQHKQELLETACDVLKENGFQYGAEITLTTEYYETRKYEELTFPAGEYLSLRVILGEGKGKNWWCVMFPPLCVPAAGDVTADAATSEEYFSPSEEKLVDSGNKYIVKFKLLEIYEELKMKINKETIK